MALLFMDSFDHYVTADLLEKYSASNLYGNLATLGIVAGSGRHSSSGLRWTTGTYDDVEGYVQRAMPASGATAVVGVGFRPGSGALSGSNGLQILAIRDATTTQVYVRLNSDHTLSVLRGNHLGTLLGTTAVALTVATFAYIELKVLIAGGTGGTLDLRINGISAAPFPLTGLNTSQTGTATWTSVVLGTINRVGNGNVNPGRNIDYDDLYVCDGSGAAPWNGLLGDCRVDPRLPTAAGATTGWAPLAGANYAAVDDTAPDDDTTYTSTTTTDATDTFVYEDAPVAGATIYGIQHCLAMKKMDAGTCTVAPVIRHSTTDYPGANLSPSTAYGYLLQIAQTNPGTSAAWTEAGFNAAEFGYKRTA